jgi:glycosyltransferase involved in cell wall biosynthesis
VLWGGGVWPWLDILTAIRAAKSISDSRDDVKFVFPGTKHPAHATAFDTYTQARTLSDELGLTDRFVYFGDWVPYSEWQDYLLEADIGISLHHDHIETHFASRSRVLSYIWGGLPMVLTKGDELCDQMVNAGVAIAVRENDTPGVARAILEWVHTPHRSALEEIFRSLRQKWSWETAVEAVVRFCVNPQEAADKHFLYDKIIHTS